MEMLQLLWFTFSDIVKKIDQSEFEGFEYINPLLMSAEECVWSPTPELCHLFFSAWMNSLLVRGANW